MFDRAHIGTAVTASFLASLVEFVEALTIVLTVLVLIFGPALQRVPITTLQSVVGVLLLAVRDALAPKGHLALGGRHRAA